MKAVLEMHILQNFAPSNLNRDDTNSPKDATFGGHRRARVSSQCFKRAMRTYVRERELLPPENRAIRTKRLLDAVVERLAGKGRDSENARQAATVALGGLGLKMKEDGKAEYLLFLGEREIADIAEAIDRSWDALATASPATGEGGKKSAKDQKKESKAAVSDEVKKALAQALRDRSQGGDAVDLALFGRMLADKPEKNQDAACQVAHALSTNKVDREFDFYTAVDDRKPDDNAGADMLGTMEFTSACFYRYLNIDLGLLHTNLQGDGDLLKRGLEAFLEAAVNAIPTGKQNSYAAHNLPSFIAFTVRQNASPRNLINAFAKPAQAHRESLVEASVRSLSTEWEKLDQFYGDGGVTHFWDGSGAQHFQHGQPISTCKDLIQRSVDEALRALEK